MQEDPPRFRVRWDDGRTTILSPAAGSVKIGPAAGSAKIDRRAEVDPLVRIVLSWKLGAGEEPTIVEEEAYGKYRQEGLSPSEAHKRAWELRISEEPAVVQEAYSKYRQQGLGPPEAYKRAAEEATQPKKVLEALDKTDPAWMDHYSPVELAPALTAALDGEGAADALRKLGPAAADALLSAVQSGHWDVESAERHRRLRALELLAELGDPRAIDPLVDALQALTLKSFGPEPWMQRALLTFGRASVSGLISVLATRRGVYGDTLSGGFAARLLGESGDLEPLGPSSRPPPDRRSLSRQSRRSKRCSRRTSLKSSPPTSSRRSASSMGSPKRSIRGSRATHTPTRVRSRSTAQRCESWRPRSWRGEGNANPHTLKILSHLDALRERVLLKRAR